MEKLSPHLDPRAFNNAQRSGNQSLNVKKENRRCRESFLIAAPHVTCCSLMSRVLFVVVWRSRKSFRFSG